MKPSTIFDACNANLKSEEIKEESDGVEKRIRYFFTPLKSFIKKDGNNGKRIKREAGLDLGKKSFQTLFNFHLEAMLLGMKDILDTDSTMTRMVVDKAKKMIVLNGRTHEYPLQGNHDMTISGITKVIRRKRGRSCPSSIKIVLPMVIQQQVMNKLGFNNEQSLNNNGHHQCFSKASNNVDDFGNTSVSKE